MARAAPAAGRRRARRRARAARHHRAAARGSDPARLRRQRLARAADAADGDPRLRRGAVGGRHQPGGEAGGSSTSSCGTRLRMERLVKDLLRLARLDAGQETLELASCDTRALVQSVVTDLTPAHRGARASASRSSIATGAETVRGRPGEAARRAAKPRRQREHLRARATRSSRRDVATRRPRSPSRSPTRVRASPTRTCRASSSGSTASTSRARAIRAAPASGLAIVKHLVELHGGTCGPKTAPTGGARFIIELQAPS